jgi:type IV pilus assembly protein PilF
MKAVSVTLLAVACLGLSGCVTQPTDDSSFGPSSTMGDESQVRARARVHMELAAGYYELGNMSVALEEAKEAQRSDPNYGPAYNIAGLIYARLKEDRLAEESFQRAVRINPNDYDALNNYGSFLCDRKQEREAVKLFLAAIRNPLYPTPERSYVNAGTCARRSGDIAAAEEYFQQALKLRPFQPQALHQLADISFERGDLAGAKTYLSRLTQVSESNAQVLWLGVRLARRMGDRNSEASYSLQLRNRYPNSAEARALSTGKLE